MEPSLDDDDEINDDELSWYYAHLGDEPAEARPEDLVKDVDPYGGARTAASTDALIGATDVSGEVVLEAMRALHAARSGDDADALAAAIDSAMRAGVSMETIEAAAQEEEGKWAQQEVSFAADALTLAIRGDDVAKLNAALERAERAGVEDATLEAARVRRNKLEADARRREARVDAERALEEARLGQDSREIDIAIEKATRSGVSVAAIAAARKRKLMLEDAKKEQARKVTSQSLEKAIRGSDIKVLVSALDWASKSGVPDETIGRARERLSVLRVEARRDKACAEEKVILEDAMKGTDIEVLDDAIESASRAGVHASVLAGARKRKLALEQQTKKRQKTAQAEAAEALELMSIGSDLEALASCIDWAQETGVSETLLALARKRMASMEEQAENQGVVDQAVSELEEVLQGSDVEALDEAIKDAEAKGAKRMVLDRARRRKKELCEKASQKLAYEEAVRSLSNAMESREVDVLTRAIDLAVRSGLSTFEVDQVRNRRTTLEAEKNLELALKTRVIQRCTSAILQAQQAGVSAKTIEAAHRTVIAWKEAERAQTIADASEKLETAMLNTDIGNISRALAVAAKVGVAEDRLHQARARLREIREAELELSRQEACRRLECAISGTDFEELTSAIMVARRSSVHNNLIAKAVSRQRVLEVEWEVKCLEAQESEALKSAIQGDDVDKLSVAIERAAAISLDKVLLDKARERKRNLQDSARKEHVSNVAANVLKSAVATAGVDGLESAINWAAEAGVCSNAVDDARKQKDALETSRKQRAVAQATKHLLEAIEGEEVAAAMASNHRLNSRANHQKALESLARAMDNAIAVGVDTSKVELAREKQMELESERSKVCGAASAALKIAMADGSLDELRIAIEEAEDAGIDGELLDRAKQRRFSLEEEKSSRDAHKFSEVSQALESAMGMGNADLLQSTISWAEAVGTNQEVLVRARTLFQKLVGRA